MLRTRSLGFGALPAITATFDPALVRGESAGAESKYAGGFVIRQHTWAQIWDEIVPGARPGSDPALGVRAVETWRAKVRAAAAELPSCDAGSLTDGGSACYYGRFLPVVGATSGDIVGDVGLLAPGSFDVYGVAFIPSEMTDGRFSRAVRPSSDQRRMMEWAILLASHERFDGTASYRWRIPGTGLIRGGVAAYIKQSTGTSPSDALITQVIRDASVDAVVTMVPDVALFLVNFERNPVQPTHAERTERGGWLAWLGRGGYPISRAVASGQVPVSDAIGLQFCASLMCKCPSSGANYEFPACVPMGFNRDGIGGKPSEGAFYPYITVNQDMTDPWFSVTLVHNDPSWITRVGNVGASFMQKIGDLFCAAQPAARAQMDAALKETCVDGNGVACTKGTPGCVCVKPPATTTASFGLVSGVAAAFCGGWQQEYGIDPMQNLPPPPPPPAPPPPPFKIPWWAVAAGGLAVGVALSTRK